MTEAAERIRRKLEEAHNTCPTEHQESLTSHEERQTDSEHHTAIDAAVREALTVAADTAAEIGCIDWFKKGKQTPCPCPSTIAGFMRGIRDEVFGREGAGGCDD